MARERRGLFSEFRRQYRLQRDIAERDKIVMEIAGRDRAFAKMEQEMGSHAHSTIGNLELQGKRLSYERGICDRKQEYDAKIAASLGGNAADMKYADMSEQTGRGLGAWIGRLVSGRLSATKRAEASAELRQMDAQEYRFFTPDKQARLDSIQPEIEEEKRDVYSEFRDAARERAARLNRDILVHERQFFGSVAPSSQETSDVFKKVETQLVHSMKSLNAPQRRLQTARMFMLTKGYTIEQIYSNEPEAIEARRVCGEQFSDIVCSKNPERIGQMWADIGDALSRIPAPDISNDLALYHNMEKLDFLTMAGINFNQVMNLRGEDTRAYQYDGRGSSTPKFDPKTGEVLRVPGVPTPAREYHSAEAAYHRIIGDRYSEHDRAIQTLQELFLIGVPDRISFMCSDEYTGVTAEALQESETANMLTRANVLERNRGFLERYRVGEPVTSSQLPFERLSFEKGQAIAVFSRMMAQDGGPEAIIANFDASKPQDFDAVRAAAERGREMESFRTGDAYAAIERARLDAEYEAERAALEPPPERDDERTFTDLDYTASDDMEDSDELDGTHRPTIPGPTVAHAPTARTAMTIDDLARPRTTAATRVTEAPELEGPEMGK